MAITRKVDTDVYCDICGKWVMGWRSDNDGVSRAWAAKYARKKGCTVGKKIICKECRIEKRSRHVAYSRRLEVQEETAMEPVWGSEVKHQTNHWRNVNGV